MQSEECNDMTVSLKPVSDVKIGVIGLGRMGRKVLERMRIRSAWDVDAVCYDCDLEVMGVSASGLECCMAWVAGDRWNWGNRWHLDPRRRYGHG